MEKAVSGDAMWTEEQNEQLMRRMDLNHTRGVQQDEFVDYCEQLLPKEEAVFEQLIGKYMRIADEKWEEQRVAALKLAADKETAARREQEILTQNESNWIHNANLSLFKKVVPNPTPTPT